MIYGLVDHNDLIRASEYFHYLVRESILRVRVLIFKRFRQKFSVSVIQE